MDKKFGMLLGGAIGIMVLAGGAVLVVSRSGVPSVLSSGERKVEMTAPEDPSLKEAEPEDPWKSKLTPEQYRITRLRGTEPAFTGKYWNHKEVGIYQCVCCKTDLFDSEHKYDSGTGWPSFTQPTEDSRLDHQIDFSLFTQRTEVLCRKCKAHLGHVFEDGPPPTRLRYCINSAALNFVPGPLPKKVEPPVNPEF